ncbi:MAG: CBS domain-containing protein [Euryarchaeota archaeon]|nr:CBS domain-containing protein [Euryarchaeota archaeon]
MKAKDLMTTDIISVDKDEKLEMVVSTMRKARISKVPVTEKGKLVGVITDGSIADELGSIKTKGMQASALHASSAMTKEFHSVGPDAEFGDIIEICKKDNVGLLPVVENGRLQGIITKADILKFVDSHAQLHTVMQRTLHAVHPGERVVHARRMMLDHGIERLPVIEQGKVVGMVGEYDIALGLDEFKKKYPPNHQAAQLKNFLVDDIMVRNVISARPETSIRDAAKTMLEKDVGALPVVDGTGKIAGMVTRTDLIRSGTNSNHHKVSGH